MKPPICRQHLLFLLLWLLSVMFLTTDKTTATPPKTMPREHQFSVVDGNLYRHRGGFVVRAVEIPEFAAVNRSATDIVPMLNRLAQHGANSLCFDLPGLSGDGHTLSEEDLLVCQQIILAATERNMGILMRVFPQHFPTGLSFRRSAVDTVARECANWGAVLFIIDGPHSNELAQALLQQATGLVVAAPEGADLLLSHEITAASSTPVLYDRIELNQLSRQHLFVLPLTSDCLQQLDDWLAISGENGCVNDATATTDALSQAAWVDLFNGQDWSGWVITGATDCWRIHDQTIEWVTSGGGVVRSLCRYQNYHLHLEWKIAAGSNSGVFINAPRDARYSKIGMEIQILDSSNQPPNIHSTGAIYDVLPPNVEASNPVGEWNQMEILVTEDHLKVVLNEHVVQDLHLSDHPQLAPRLRQGFIGLQDHGGYVAFRNLRLRPLK